jgi:Uma2 family endonuclease
MSVTVAELSLEQYLEQEIHAPEKHEFVDGQLYAMAGATEAHNLICTNLVFALQLATRAAKKRCRIMQSDMKVVIETEPRVAYYPNVVVVCDDSDTNSNFKTRPCLIVEVLSESTKRVDQTEKKLNYQRLDSLKAYLLVHQDEQLVELHRKLEDGTWQHEKYQSGAALELPCPSITLSLEQIYEGVQP